MEHLEEFVASATKLLDYPEDMDTNGFVAYDIAVISGEESSVRLIKALSIFNENNPLTDWGWDFHLKQTLYREISLERAKSFLIYALHQHLPFYYSGRFDQEELSGIANYFLEGECLTAFTNHGSFSSSGATWSNVRSPETHESFLALVGDDKVRIFNCWEND